MTREHSQRLLECSSPFYHPRLCLPSTPIYSQQLLTTPTHEVYSPTQLPSVESRPLLRAALDELDGLVGLHTIKQQVQRLEVLAKVNYERELDGEAPLDTPLNRLFLGNPGTGKTTVAGVYGRVLAALGFLSDGTVELKTPRSVVQTSN